MSEYSSSLGPDFYISAGEHKCWSFQRATDGPEEGGVQIDLLIDGEIHHSVFIDQAAWESVLAHVCKAPHDGAAFAAAANFHEADPNAR